MMMAAIGEMLEDEQDNEVMGVVVNIRKAFWRVGLWTRTSGQGPKPGRGGAPPASTESAEESRKRLERIGTKFKDVLALPPGEVVEFSGHADSAHAGSTRAKAKFSV